MSFRLVPKSVTLNDLNGVMAVTLRYFTEFGKSALQKTMCGGIYARDLGLYCVGGTLSLTQSIYCIFSECTMSSQRKFTFAISSPDEFLVSLVSCIVSQIALYVALRNEQVYDDNDNGNDDDDDHVMAYRPK